MSLAGIIDKVITTEGGYSNNPNDSGGETNFGITLSTARHYGYLGAMKDMPRAIAVMIYTKQYVLDWNFHLVYNINERIGAELIDTGVNCGQGTATKVFQRALNSLNNIVQGHPNMALDGIIGPASILALSTYLKTHNTNGELVLLRAMNCLQGTHYIELVEKYQKNEEFIFGWLLNRVTI